MGLPRQTRFGHSCGRHVVNGEFDLLKIHKNFLSFFRIFADIFEDFNFVRKTSILLNFVRRASRFQMEATLACKQPRRSDLTSDLKFRAQITYATMDDWTVFPLLDQMMERRKKRTTNLPLLELSASPQLKTTFPLSMSN